MLRGVQCVSVGREGGGVCGTHDLIFFPFRHFNTFKLGCVSTCYEIAKVQGYVMNTNSPLLPCPQRPRHPLGKAITRLDRGALSMREHMATG